MTPNNSSFSNAVFHGNDLIILFSHSRQITVVNPDQNTIVSMNDSVIILENTGMSFRYEIYYPDAIGAQSALVRFVNFIHGIDIKEELNKNG
ncbi:hypothetical protein SPLA10_PHROGS00113 [Salmonella phage SPLA10]|nr:hypothetical protein SPLA10_PHROGS00113 [Salmonella phage SPLA10]